MPVVAFSGLWYGVGGDVFGIVLEMLLNLSWCLGVFGGFLSVNQAVISTPRQ